MGRLAPRQILFVPSPGGRAEPGPKMAVGSQMTPVALFYFFFNILWSYFMKNCVLKLRLFVYMLEPLVLVLGVFFKKIPPPHSGVLKEGRALCSKVRFSKYRFGGI